MIFRKNTEHVIQCHPRRAMFPFPFRGSHRAAWGRRPRSPRPRRSSAGSRRGGARACRRSGGISPIFVVFFFWLVVWTPLKNISQLGWLFPIYGKIKNVPNHQPVLWCFFSINHYFNSSPKDVDLVFSIVPNLRGHETKKWTAARPKNPQAKQALFVWREELMPQRPNPTP